MGGRQVDRVEGSYAWIGNQMIKIDPQKRLTSARLRRLIYYVMAVKTPKELSDIRKNIESKMEDGEFFSQGQLAGVVKKMSNSEELMNLGWGIYQAGPAFDRKAAVYMEQTPAALTPPETVRLLPEQEDADERGFSKKRGELLTKLEISMKQIIDEVNDVKVSELSDEDFNFIREFRQLDKLIQDFCNKYR